MCLEGVLSISSAIIILFYFGKEANKKKRIKKQLKTSFYDASLVEHQHATTCQISKLTASSLAMKSADEFASLTTCFNQTL